MPKLLRDTWTEEIQNIVREIAIKARLWEMARLINGSQWDQLVSTNISTGVHFDFLMGEVATRYERGASIWESVAAVIEWAEQMKSGQ